VLTATNPPNTVAWAQLVDPAPSERLLGTSAQTASAALAELLATLLEGTVDY
jgi:hypothetical protein